MKPFSNRTEPYGHNWLRTRWFLATGKLPPDNLSELVRDYQGTDYRRMSNARIAALIKPQAE